MERRVLRVDWIVAESAHDARLNLLSSGGVEAGVMYAVLQLKSKTYFYGMRALPFGLQ